MNPRFTLKSLTSGKARLFTTLFSFPIKSAFSQNFNIKNSILVLGLLALSAFTAFLTHSRSTFIWQAISILSFVQFPWRFLGIVIFALSLALSYIARPKIFFRKAWLMLIIALVILLNYGYFVPWNRSYKVRDDEKLSGIAFELQQKSAILDYLPKTAPIAPKEKAPDEPWLIDGEGQAYNFSKRSNSFFFDAQIYSKEAEVQIPVMDYPNWVVVGGGKIIDSYPSGDYGVITIKLPEGKHIIQGRFENSEVRELGNLFTVISFSILFFGIILKVNNKKFLWI
jgi:hypothetical protein